MGRSAAELKPGEQGTITGFTDEVISLKLMEMGCLPGSIIKMKFFAPFGDPLAIEVAGYSLSLRYNEASTVLID